MASELDYSTIFNQIGEWSFQLHLSKQKIVIGDREYDKQAFRDFSLRVKEIFPAITQSLFHITQNAELVYTSDPVDTYPISPYVTLHTSLQELERSLICETLMRAENFTNLPVEISSNIPRALKQMRALSKVERPYLADETIKNLTELPTLEGGLWEQMVGGMMRWHDVLSRTLAAKHKYSRSPVQGYNRRAVQLCDFQLFFLDEVGKCTPWQLRWNQSSYTARIKGLAFSFVSERTGVDRYTESGKMWSDEMLESLEAEGWISSLQTGH